MIERQAFHRLAACPFAISGVSPSSDGSKTFPALCRNAEGPAAGRLRAPLGILVNFVLLVAPQLGLHGHLGSLWLNSVIAAGTSLER